MNYFIDDRKNPDSVSWLPEKKSRWEVVRTAHDLPPLVETAGIPRFISFGTLEDDERTLTPVKWLIDYCANLKKPFPVYCIHAMKPEIRSRIERTITDASLSGRIVFAKFSDMPPAPKPPVVEKEAPTPKPVEENRSILNPPSEMLKRGRGRPRNIAVVPATANVPERHRAPSRAGASIGVGKVEGISAAHKAAIQRGQDEARKNAAGIQQDETVTIHLTSRRGRSPFDGETAWSVPQFIQDAENGNRRASGGPYFAIDIAGNNLGEVVLARKTTFPAGTYYISSEP